MSDLIDRQAAIDAINRICPVDTEYDCTLLDRVDVRYVLSDLPSAQPEKRTEERTETHGVCLDAISRQAAIDAAECIVEHHSITPYKTMAAAMDHLKRILNGMPFAQPQMVRCKNCKYIVAEKYDGITSYYCERLGICCTGDDFCSFAERKDDE